MTSACCLVLRVAKLVCGRRVIGLALTGLVGLGAGPGRAQAQGSPASGIPTPPPRPFNLGSNLPKAQIVLPTPERVPQATAAPQILSTPTPPARPPSLTFTPPPSAVARAAALAAAGGAPKTETEPAPVPDAAPAQPVVAALPTPPSAPEPTFGARLKNFFTPSTRPADEEEDEWPRRTPGQRGLPGGEQAFDPNEKPDRPGLSTDPGVSTKCLPALLQTVLQKVIARYGAVKVTSTYRPAWRARRGSYHRRCEAVDFRVPGVRPGEVLALVKTYEETGGHKVYWNGLIHVDTGPYRTWRGARR